MADLMNFLWEVIIPRIVTEDVAVNWDDDGYEVVCPVSELDPYERHMGACEITAFSWLGFGWGGKMKVPPREFYNPNKGK